MLSMTVKANPAWSRISNHQNKCWGWLRIPWTWHETMKVTPWECFGGTVVPPREMAGRQRYQPPGCYKWKASRCAATLFLEVILFTIVTAAMLSHLQWMCKLLQMQQATTMGSNSFTAFGMSCQSPFHGSWNHFLLKSPRTSVVNTRSTGLLHKAETIPCIEKRLPPQNIRSDLHVEVDHAFWMGPRWSKVNLLLDEEVTGLYHLARMMQMPDYWLNLALWTRLAA